MFYWPVCRFGRLLRPPAWLVICVGQLCCLVIFNLVIKLRFDGNRVVLFLALLGTCFVEKLANSWKTIRWTRSTLLTHLQILMTANSWKLSNNIFVQILANPFKSLAFDVFFSSNFRFLCSDQCCNQWSIITIRIFDNCWRDCFAN